MLSLHPLFLVTGCHSEQRPSSVVSSSRKRGTHTHNHLELFAPSLGFGRLVLQSALLVVLLSGPLHPRHRRLHSKFLSASPFRSTHQRQDRAARWQQRGLDLSWFRAQPPFRTTVFLSLFASVSSAVKSLILFETGRVSCSWIHFQNWCCIFGPQLLFLSEEFPSLSSSHSVLGQVVVVDVQIFHQNL